MEILTNLEKKILNLFSSLSDKDVFYLTGGTALSAFFLKHRKSHDLDFFTNVEELILPFNSLLFTTHLIYISSYAHVQCPNSKNFLITGGKKLQRRLQEEDEGKIIYMPYIQGIY